MLELLKKQMMFTFQKSNFYVKAILWDVRYRTWLTRSIFRNILRYTFSVKLEFVEEKLQIIVQVTGPTYSRKPFWHIYFLIIRISTCNYLLYSFFPFFYDHWDEKRRINCLTSSINFPFNLMNLIFLIIALLFIC